MKQRAACWASSTRCAIRLRRQRFRAFATALLLALLLGGSLAACVITGSEGGSGSSGSSGEGTGTALVWDEGNWNETDWQ